MKLVWAIVIMVALSASAQAARTPVEPPFGSLSWSDSPSNLDSGKLIGHGSGLAIYQRSSDVSQVLGLAVKGVEYAYFQDRLMVILITTTASSDDVETAIAAKYGPSTKDPPGDSYDERRTKGDTAILYKTGSSKLAFASVSLSKAYERAMHPPHVTDQAA